MIYFFSGHPVLKQNRCLSNIELALYKMVDLYVFTCFPHFFVVRLFCNTGWLLLNVITIADIRFRYDKHWYLRSNNHISGSYIS